MNFLSRINKWLDRYLFLLTVLACLIIASEGQTTEPSLATLAQNFAEIICQESVGGNAGAGRVAVNAVVDSTGNIVSFWTGRIPTLSAGQRLVVFEMPFLNPSQIEVSAGSRSGNLPAALVERARNHLRQIFSHSAPVTVQAESRAAQIAARTSIRFASTLARVGAQSLSRALSVVLRTIGARFTGPIGELLLNPTELGWEDDPGPCTNRLTRTTDQVAAYIALREAEAWFRCQLQAAHALRFNATQEREAAHYADERRGRAIRLENLLNAEIPRLLHRSACGAFIRTEMEVLSAAYDLAKSTNYLEGCSAQSGQITIRIPLNLASGPVDADSKREPTHAPSKNGTLRRGPAR